MNKMPRLRSISGWGIGRGIHRLRASVRERVGAIMNRAVEEKLGRKGSLMNSFMASENGCNRPYGPTTFGPLRNCM